MDNGPHIPSYHVRNQIVLPQMHGHLAQRDQISKGFHAYYVRRIGFAPCLMCWSSNSHYTSDRYVFIHLTRHQPMVRSKASWIHMPYTRLSVIQTPFTNELYGIAVILQDTVSSLFTHLRFFIVIYQNGLSHLHCQSEILMVQSATTLNAYFVTMHNILRINILKYMNNVRRAELCQPICQIF